MSATDQPSEQELRAAYEAELKKIRVEHVLLEQAVTLVNLGMRRTGMAPGTEDERDLEQVRQAIEGVRALLPLVEPALGPDAASVRDALSQLQLAYARAGGAAGGAGAASGQPADPGARPGGERPGGAPEGGSQPPPEPGGPGPAQSSGRLWVPGR
jgi:hypothetical protein